MQKDSKIYVAGHNGLVGSAITRKLAEEGYHNVVVRNHKELDLENQQMTEKFFEKELPEYVFMAAAKVGGIKANSESPADFIGRNIRLQTNVIDYAYKYGVKKFLFLGSSCIYPKLCPQPIKEEYLLTGPLEPTNEWYALAKIAGIKMCQAYRKQYGWNVVSAMPTNLYGINDNFDLDTSHVMPALIRKFHEAKESGASEVVVWGSGKPLREFLYVDDLADALLHIMLYYDDYEHINVGTGEDLTIGQLAELVRDVVEYEGDIVYDASKPDGTPRKLLDVSRLLNMGWKAQTSIEDGIQMTYEWFIQSYYE